MIANCDLPDDDSPEALDEMLTRYSNDFKPALHFMKTYKYMDFKILKKELELPVLVETKAALALPKYHRKTESLNSQERTRLVSQSGALPSPSPIKISADTTRVQKFEFDSSEKSLEFVDIILPRAPRDLSSVERIPILRKTKPM